MKYTLKKQIWKESEFYVMQIRGVDIDCPFLADKRRGRW